MLVSQKLQEAMNAQIGHEFGAKLQYVSIGSYFAADDLPQLAGFFYRQADEEDMHAMKFVHYLIDVDGQVQIPVLQPPMPSFNSAEEAVQAALAWEQKVTGQINALMDLAIADNDHMAQDFLRWFVTEQREEVATMKMLLNTVRRSGGNLLWVEDYLARNPPAQGGPANTAA
jgi:ferritin